MLLEQLIDVRSLLLLTYVETVSVMSIVDRLFGLVGLSAQRDEEVSHRCVRCGGGFDRAYQACPDCGAAFVAPVDSELETGRDTEDETLGE